MNRTLRSIAFPDRFIVKTCIRLGLAVLMPRVTVAEIPCDHYLPLTPQNVLLWHYTSTKKPVLTVKSGETVRIDGGGGVRWDWTRGEDGNAWLRQNGIPLTIETSPTLQETLRVLTESERPPDRPSGRHILTGPVYVEDAEPGDSLEIRILDVTPRIPYGATSGRPGGGTLPDLVPRPFTKVTMLDLKRNVGIFDAKVEVPLGPFMGVMATCPPDSEGPFRNSSPPGVFGGNLDCKELVAGSTLYLPVFHKGALFYTGDSHAGQGDGEVTGNAIETANTCTLQFILHKGKKLTAPRAETPTHYITFGLDPDLDKALRMALVETIGFLGEKEGYDFIHAYALASIAVDFRVTQSVDRTLGVHGMIPRKLFVQDTNTYWYRP
ncbi:acetamidase [Opitutaceae bacterium TAV5]|nr:acetamidase [Opitutaceae bacterium TAV5]